MHKDVTTNVYQICLKMDDNKDQQPCMYYTYIHEKEWHILQEKVPDVKVIGYQSDSKTGIVEEFEDDAIAHKVDILVTNMRVFSRYRQKFTGLKWVHCRSNGIDFLTKRAPKEELQKPPYLFTRNQGYVNAPYAAQYIIGQIIARERFLYEAKDAQRRHEYNQSICNDHRTLSELSVGILGFGQIGQEVGRICKVFGMTVWGLTRRPRPEKDDTTCVDVCRTQDGLIELLESCDYVVGCLPSTDKTRGMLSGDVLSHCQQKRAVFMNVGRGDLVDNDSLINALRNGWLRGAILDATDGEPIAADNPLWDEPGVTITPHISAYSRNRQYASEVMDIVVDNYRRYVKGEPLQGIVDFKEGY